VSSSKIFHFAETKEDGLVHDASPFQVLDHNSLEKLGRDSAVPYALGIDDDDRASRARAEARGFAALYPRRSEEEVLSLEKRGELRVERAAPPVGRAKSPGADEDMT
jgi:hypothetical protein